MEEKKATGAEPSTGGKNLDTCIAFLNSIGIKTICRSLEHKTFLPGLSIEAGCIIIDKVKLKYPGDMLHEAAHIAVVPAADRATLNEEAISNRPYRDAEELMAIAWSYAACIHLNIDPYFVFHEDGYQGGGSYIADNFAEKKYFGLPMLQWKGMAADEKKAIELKVAPYPNMIRWMLD